MTKPWYTKKSKIVAGAKSACCGASAVEKITPGGTFYYECRNCQDGCDLKYKKEKNGDY